MLVALILPRAASGATCEFPLPTVNALPHGITAGPDGALWFTEGNGNKVGRITTAGAISEFPLPTDNAIPAGITAGPDGALWFTERSADKIGRITTAGSISEFPLPTLFYARPWGITTGPDGALWFTEAYINGNKIGRITTVGAISEFPPLPTADSEPHEITAGPDGALWFTEELGNKIGRITTAGGISEFPLTTVNAVPYGITAGPDGALWFTEGNKIGRITTAGGISESPLPTAGSGPGGIAAGPDGALWFTETSADKIGRITTAGGISEFPTPTARSHPMEITAGPDGALWFTELYGDKIGRIATGAAPATLEVKKTLIPSTDPGRFNLQIDGSTKADAGDGDTTGKQPVSPCTYTVGEAAGSATDLSDYTSQIDCKDQGGAGSTIASSSDSGPINVNVAAGADVVCTITNTRRSPPTSTSNGLSGAIPSPFAGIALASQTATVAKNGKLQLSLPCPATAVGNCAGTDTLKTAGAIAAKHKKKGKKRVLTLGSASFSIPAGRIGKVTIKLSKVALKLIAKKHTLKVLEVVVAHDSRGLPKTSTSTVTLKAPKKKKKR